MIRANVNEFGLIITSATSAANGATITPGNNTYGTYSQLISGASVTDDAYGFWINFNSISVSGSARDALAKIGIDPAGGTTYTDLVTDLLVSCAGVISGVGGGGIWYYFPLSIKAGTSIAVALSVNNGTVGTGQSFIRLFCRPTHPELVRVGSFVRTFGSTPASSSGTSITPNAAGGKSSYVQVGSALVESLWYWVLGIGINNSVMNNNPCAWDLSIGDATNKRLIIVDQITLPSTSESLSYTSIGANAVAATGDIVYIRAGGPAAHVTGMSAAGYGIGG